MTLDVKYLNVLLMVLMSAFYNISNAQSIFSYPSTRMQEFDTIIYNKKISDNYAWLSKIENEKEMYAWARNQGLYTNQILDSVSGDEILDSLLNKIYNNPNQKDIIVRGTQENKIFYSKTLSGNKRWLVMKVNGSEKEELIIEMPFSINGKKYTAKKYAFAHEKTCSL